MRGMPQGWIPPTTCPALWDVFSERIRQDEKWGEQNHPDGTGTKPIFTRGAELARQLCEEAFAAGEGTWRHILCEEVAESLAESDTRRLRAELVQVAAVAVAWVECIDRRNTANGKA